MHENGIFGPFTVQTVAAGIDKLGRSDADFAAGLLASFRRYDERGWSVSPKMCAAMVRLADKVSGHAPAAPAASPVADQSGMSAIQALFAKAGERLAHPAVILSSAEGPIRVAVAGERARVPGSLSVTTEGRYGERDWIGRILRSGEFEPGRKVAGTATEGHAIETLRRFAADPATVAAEHGRLTGHCAFCARRLDDERSTAVGYGPTCAENWGLPWGASAPKAAKARAVAKPEPVAAAPAQPAKARGPLGREITAADLLAAL